MKHSDTVKTPLRFLNGIWTLTKRNILIFTKNKATVFFSLIAPILIFALYTLFMGDMMLATITDSLPDGIDIEKKLLSGVFNAWMISGVVGIACLSVALNSLIVMISDKENKIINDFNASPFGTIALSLSYFLASVIITFVLCFIVLTLTIIFLSATSGVMFSIFELLELLFILFISVLSASVIMMCIMSFMKTNAAITAFFGVFSAIIGFLTGAYLPISLLPPWIQNIANLLPASHSNGLFRKVLLGKMLEKIPATVPNEFIAEMSTTYSYTLKLFGFDLSVGFMYLFLLGSTALILGSYLLINKIIKNKSKKTK